MTKAGLRQVLDYWNQDFGYTRLSPDDEHWKTEGVAVVRCREQVHRWIATRVQTKGELSISKVTHLQSVTQPISQPPRITVGRM